MALNKWTSFLLILLLSGAPAFSSAQTSNGKVKRSIATVVLGGLGGAVLGLSTLSFYDSANEHTENISLGALIGALGGLGYLVYQNQGPSQSNEVYDYSGIDPQIKRALETKSKAPLFVRLDFSF